MVLKDLLKENYIIQKNKEEYRFQNKERLYEELKTAQVKYLSRFFIFISRVLLTSC